MQRQVNAYNQRNLDAFLEPYADGVQVHAYASRLLYSGKARMRERYATLFKSTPQLHCEIVHRLVLGNTVIDHERVTGLAENALHAVAIYTIENGKIARVEFVQSQPETAVATLQECASCPAMVVVPAGGFLMGDLHGDSKRDNELPVHRVDIARDFAVGRFPVTFREWDTCVEEGGCGHRPDDQGWGRGSQPVIDVSWNDVQQYLGWLSRKTKATYRLLSEAEWEYVARSATTTKYHYGNNPDHEQMNYGHQDPRSKGLKSLHGIVEGRDQWPFTSPVGSFPPNAFGVYDMHGNVWEWVQDCYSQPDTFERSPADGSAWDAEPGETQCLTGKRILRGGAWNFPAEYATASYRGAWDVDERRNDFGFRVARSLQP